MLHGIEELTKDGEAYIYWRGVHVEHYSFREPEREAEAARNLAASCHHLEALGVPVTCGSAVWYWPWYQDLTREQLENQPPLVRALLFDHRDLYEDPSGRFCWIGERPDSPPDYPYTVQARIHVCDHGEQTSFMLESDDMGGFYYALIRRGWQIAQMGQAKNNGCCYATTAQLLAWFDAKMSPPLVQPISFDLVPGVTIAFGVTKERA